MLSWTDEASGTYGAIGATGLGPSVTGTCCALECEDGPVAAGFDDGCRVLEVGICGVYEQIDRRSCVVRLACLEGMVRGGILESRRDARTEKVIETGNVCGADCKSHCI